MEKETKKNSRITNVSNALYDSMLVTEIEKRLESDPLVPGGLIELETNNDGIVPLCLWNEYSCSGELIVNK